MAPKFVDGFVCPMAIQSRCFPSSLSVGDWAAWAQAVGTVGAIVATICVVIWQLRSDARRTKQIQIQQLRVLWMLVYHCRVEMQHSNAEYRIPGACSFVEPNGLRHKIEALRGIPLLDLPDSDAALAVLTAVDAYDAFASGTATDGQSAEPSGTSQAHNFIGHSNVALENFSFAERRLRLTLLSRGSDIEVGRTYSLNGQRFAPLSAL